MFYLVNRDQKYLTHVFFHLLQFALLAISLPTAELKNVSLLMDNYGV